MLKLSKVGGPYGAPMGRPSYDLLPGDTNRRKPLLFRLYRVRLDAGGYDSGGAYWGIGAPLYCAEAENPDAACAQDEWIEMFFRAYGRDGAKEIVREKYPAARFYR